MDQLTLEPVCDSQIHIYIQRNGNDNCNSCNKKLTNYRCKNCDHELCNSCHADMILNIRSDQLKRTKNLLLEERKKIRQQDIQLNNDYRDTIDKYDKDDKDDRYDRYDKDDKYDRYDRYDKDDKYDKYDKYDTIDRYNGKSQKIIVRDRRGRRNSYNKSGIIHRNDRQLVGRKLSEKPRNRSLSCFEKFFKYR